jgi:hypothetical protein
VPHPTPLTRPPPRWLVCARVKTHGAPAPDQRLTLSASRRASHRKTPSRKAFYRRTLNRSTPKITIIAAGSALALAGIAAGTVAAWPGDSPAASASVAGASFSGTAAAAQTLTGAAATDNGLAKSAQELKAAEATARLAALRQAIARQEARKATRARAAAAAKAAAAQAAARAAARAASQKQASAAAPSVATPSGSPQQIAEGMLGSYGWSSSQFSCLQPLWNAESGWNVSATNTSSGAYGIPQALPGSKMASAGADWQTDAATQIRWGLGYIRSVYGSPCGAWSHEQAYGWY